MILKSDFVKVIFASAGASDIRYKGAGGKKKQGFVAHFPPGTKKKGNGAAKFIGGSRSPLAPLCCEAGVRQALKR
jgi:hypothetical protein